MAERLPPLPAADNLPANTAGESPTCGVPEVDFPALIVAHHAALFRYAYRLSGCSAEADDLTQQTFLVAQRKLHQLREADRAGAWLFAVLRSVFFKSLRRQRPATAASLNLEVDQFAGPTPVVEEVDRERLAAALAQLPDEFRLVVLMFYFEELSYQEIAEQLEIPIGTVMSRLSRAKGHLRRRLDEAEGLRPPASVSPAAREISAGGSNHSGSNRPGSRNTSSRASK